jgi:hypothetical protein
MRKFFVGGLSFLGVLALRCGAEAAPPRTTVVRPGEDCQAIVRRVYGSAPGAMARFHAANPQMGGLPHVLKPGDVVNIPRLPTVPGTPEGRQAQRRPRREEPPRLSYVGPAVRTQGRNEAAWTEALPDQPVPRRTRIRTSPIGGAEVSLSGRLRLQLPPNSTLVVGGLSDRQAGVELVDGTLLVGSEREPLLVRTGAAELRLRGGARIDAEGGKRALLSVYEGSARVRTRGTEVQVPAGAGTVVQAGARPAAPHPLPDAPAWPDGRPLLALSIRELVSTKAVPAIPSPPAPLPEGEGGRTPVALEFTRVPGAEQYLVEVARDERFNDRKAGGEVVSPPFVASLPPGSYLVRVSAIDADHLVGRPSAVRRLVVLPLLSDAEVALEAGGSGRQQIVLRRTQSAALRIPRIGLPVQVSVNGRAPFGDPPEGGQLVQLGPGTHRVTLRAQDAEAELLVLVAPRPREEPAGVEPPELPVPLSTPGFPVRALAGRSRAWALFGIGASQADRRLDVYRLDLGGEIAFLQRRLSADLNLPILYHDSGADGGMAVGDLALGFRALAYSALAGHLSLGPLLRLQLPTGTFARAEEPGSKPVVLDPALGVSYTRWRLGLLTTQGPTAVLNVAAPRLRWSMSYVATLAVAPQVALSVELDASLAAVGGGDHGAALGGGARVRLPGARGQLRLLFGARGGLGDGGQAVFGRYQASAGVEWLYR